MNPAGPPITALGRCARTVVWCGFIYWGVIALVCPVMTIDSQMYNLARVELALRDGFFGNDYFTSVFHIIYPWSFDALHLPFLLLGWGYALPSYLCLVGTSGVVLTMTRARFGPDAAWAGVLSLLALPCLVYQATSTKNDIILLFAGAVWVYARWRAHREANGAHRLWMVLALGFMAGAKTTGLPLAAILGTWTLWEVRSNRRLLLQTAAGLVGAVLLLGSGETYYESARLYGHPLGPPALLHRASNVDGLRGGLANFIRHSAGGIYVGPTDFSDGQRAVTALNSATRSLLDWAGLTDAGIARQFPDKNLFLPQSGMEELSGFGPLGTFALGTMLWAGLRWRRTARWWQLGFAGLLGLMLVSLTVGYNSWTNRYLIAWYALGAVAFTIALWETGGPWRRPLQWGCILLASASAVAAPWLSFNRGPASILAAFCDRERLETSATPVLGRVRERLRQLREQSPHCRIFVVAHDESVVLPLLEDRSLAVILTREVIFRRLALNGQVSEGDLVVRESPVDWAPLTLAETVTAPNVYSFNQTSSRYIYRVTTPLRNNH